MSRKEIDELGEELVEMGQGGLTIDDIEKYDVVEIELLNLTGEWRGPWLVQIMGVNKDRNTISYEFYGNIEDEPVTIKSDEIMINKFVDDPDSWYED